jgi:hypothetical protein
MPTISTFVSDLVPDPISRPIGDSPGKAVAVSVSFTNAMRFPVPQSRQVNGAPARTGMPRASK